MKKLVVCFILVFVLLLSGCFTYHYIEAEPGSNWESNEPLIRVTIINPGRAEGTLISNGEIIYVEFLFGPGKTDFAVYKLENVDVDGCLLEGDYHYDKQEETITLAIVEDKVGIGKNEIILSKE